MAVPAQLIDQLVELPVRDRAELAKLLIDSLSDQFDEDVDSTWEAELKRRAEDILNGKVKGEPAEVVMARLREKHN